MLKKLIIGVIVANFVFMLGSIITTRDDILVPSFASTTIGGPASAHIDGVLELISGGIKQIPYNEPLGNNPWLYPNATNGYDLGTLLYQSDQGYFIGANYYCTLMIPVTSGRPYRIVQSGTSLTGANGTIADNGFMQIPSYQWSDVLGNATQGAPPADAFCGAITSAAGSGHVVYEDGGTSGVTKIIRGIVSIGQPEAGQTYPRNFSRGYNGNQSQGTEQVFSSWTPVGAETQPGDYSGSVTYTLNLI
jgi:hypothetical protein